MIDWLRQKLLNFIEEHDTDTDWNWTNDIKWSITSNYYPDVLRAFREICDWSLWKNEDGSLYFLPFWIDTVWDEDKYTEAFTEITIWDNHYSIMFDSCVKDDFCSIDEFVDTIIDLTEQADNIKNTFNLLRPVYNEQ